jgi:hypothetical protein
MKLGVLFEDKWQLIVNPQRLSVEKSAMIDDPLKFLVDRGMEPDFASYLLQGAIDRKTPLNVPETDRHWRCVLVPPGVTFSNKMMEVAKNSIEMIRDYFDVRDVDVGPVMFTAREGDGYYVMIDGKDKEMKVTSYADRWPEVELSLKYKYEWDYGTGSVFPRNKTVEGAFTIGDDFDEIMAFWNQS